MRLRLFLFQSFLKTLGSSYRPCGRWGKGEENGRSSGSWLGMDGVDNSRFSTGLGGVKRPSTPLPRMLDLSGQLLHKVVHSAVLFDQPLDLGGRVHHGRVV